MLGGPPILVYVTTLGNWMSWGTKSASVTGLSFTVLDSTLHTNNNLTPTPSMDNDDSKPDWVFYYTKMQAGLTFYLQPSYSFNGVLQSPDPWGPFTTAAP
jgi:hypothetical protein